MSDQTPGIGGDASATMRMPRSGPPIDVGSRVVIRVSKGPSPITPAGYVTVPPLVGEPQSNALTALQDLGLAVDVVNDYSAGVPRAHVVGTLPHSGQNVAVGTQVVMMVSNGPAQSARAQTALPVVVGMTEAQAADTLKTNSLVPQSVYEYSAAVPEGVVIDQLPSASSLAEVPVKKRSLAWLWILLAVLALIAVGLLIWSQLGKNVGVPNVIGMTQKAAQDTIVSAGFQMGAVATTPTASSAAVGKVVAQTPAGGTAAKQGSAINIVVAVGQSKVAVPSVVGMNQTDAQNALSAAGLTSAINSVPSNDVPKGNVVAQSPAAGQQVAPGTSVTLAVSAGSQNVSVPAVVGMSQADAQNALKAAGLSVKSTTANDASPEGNVYGQSPSAGTVVAPGTVVNIQVSAGPAPQKVSVPDVLGQTKSNATTMLKDAGFVVQSSTLATGTTVTAQSPSGGTQANKGSTVKITIGTNP